MKEDITRRSAGMALMRGGGQMSDGSYWGGPMTQSQNSGTV